MVDQIELYLDNTDDFDWNDLKSGVKDAMSKFFYEQTKRRPVVMPVVMEVNQNRRPNSKKRLKIIRIRKNKSPKSKARLAIIKIVAQGNVLNQHRVRFGQKRNN